MLKLKSAQFNPQPDFGNTGVRRLMGTLSNTRDYATQAYERLERYISDQKFDLTVEDIQADHELAYALNGALGNEWQKIITGGIL